MKKPVFLFVVCLVAAGAIFAQTITASPLEGRWEWNKSGEEPDYIEIVFFGNMMLGTDDLEFYDGAAFTYTRNNINIADGEMWRYRLSGGSLVITYDDGSQYTYRKARSTVSPLQGIWYIDYEGDRVYFIFTDDIMALGDEEYFEGGKVRFRNNTIYNEAYPDDVIQYTLNGNSLTMTVEDEKLVFTKIY
jgi:hypothetical protein